MEDPSKLKLLCRSKRSGNLSKWNIYKWKFNKSNTKNGFAPISKIFTISFWGMKTGGVQNDEIKQENIAKYAGVWKFSQ